MFELEANDDDSKGNVNEVELVKSHINELLDAGVRMCDIGVITPYNLQVSIMLGFFF